MTFKRDDRVSCLATLFDKDSEDSQGRTFSQRHALAGHGTKVYGTVKRVLRNRTVKVLWDGDTTQLSSSAAHLTLENDDSSDGDSSSSSNEGESDPSTSHSQNGDAESESAGPAAQDPVVEPRHEDEWDAGSEESLDGSEAVRLGGTVEVGGNTWKRVRTMGECSRGTKPRKRFNLKAFTFTSKTTKRELWEHLLPVPLSRLLQVAQANAEKHNDKKSYYTADGLLTFFAILFSGCQFLPGTDMWSKKRKGMLPPLNYGHFMSRDRFDRWFRYLSEGPPDLEHSDDPWWRFRWLVDGFNDNRRRNVECGFRILVDESIFEWRSGSIPHMSFIPRKPKPYGCEMKNALCCDSKCMVFMEIQEGKIRMQRKRYCRSEPATTACTLRLAKGCNVDELGVDPGDSVHRVVLGDSWFASVRTALALKEKFGVSFVGCIKTAHKGFPIEAMRHTLASMERGDHCVFHCEELALHAVGWHDNYFKTYVGNCFTSSDGVPAEKKRQRDDGTNFKVQVPRPHLVQELQECAQGIDGHNQKRQGVLKLEEFWKVKQWYKRMFTSIMSSCLVDTINIWEYFNPPMEPSTSDDFASRNVSFAADLINELLPKSNNSERWERPDSSDICHLELTQKTEVKAVGAKSVGRVYRTQQRCAQCIANKRFGKNGRAPKTSWRCTRCANVFLCPSDKSNCLEEHRALTSSGESSID